MRGATSVSGTKLTCPLVSPRSVFRVKRTLREHAKLVANDPFSDIGEAFHITYLSSRMPI
jgi:hypothetical protein